MTRVVELEHELLPRRGAKTTWETEARFWHDGKHLIVDVRAMDPEPSRLVVVKGQRDAVIGDAISVRVDPLGDGGRSFVLTATAAGVVADRISSSRGLSNASWNGEWQAESTLEPDGYRIRFTIPFETIDVSPGADGEATIGLSVRRLIGRGRQEIVGWPLLDPLATCPDCASQRIRLADIDRAAPRWHVVPYVTLARNERFNPVTGERTEKAASRDLGLDIRYEPDPGRQLMMTINPDFSQVEIDSFHMQVNRRFAVTLAERRPFFTENAGALDGSSLRLLYTRTITEPSWGIQGRMTGKSGQSAVLLADDVRTSLILPGTYRSQVVSLDQASHNAVARVTGRWNDSLHHSVQMTHRQGSGYGNSVVGGTIGWERDARQSLRLELAASHARNPAEWQSSYGLAPEQSGLAGVLRHHYQGAVYDSRTNLTAIGADFRADLGSLRRTGIRSLSHLSNWMFERDPETHRLTGWGFNFSGLWTVDQDNRVIFSNTDAVFGVGFRDGTSLHLGHGVGRDRVGERLFPVTMTGVNGRFPLTERLSLDLGTGWGDAVDFSTAETARMKEGRVSISYSGARIRTSASTRFETLGVGGDLKYRARIDNARLTYTPSNRHQVNLILTAHTLHEPGREDDRTAAGQIGYRYQRDAHTAFILGMSTHALESGLTHGLQKTNRYVFTKLSMGF